MESKRMIGKLNLLFLAIGLFITLPTLIGQDLDQDIPMEENAEVSLEVYSDEFQEFFFEALKQKGIENYDKAIALLLECKKLDPSNQVIDHELAKAFFEDKQYPIAEDYAMVAFLAEPGNVWFLDTLVAIIEQQGGSSDLLIGRLPKGNFKALENLALIYYQKGDFENSLQALKLLKQSRFAEDLLTKINDSLKQKKVISNEKQVFDPSSASDVENSFERYKIKIEQLIGANQPLELERISAEALEQYPSQPFLYYAQGLALNRLTRHTEAVELLETGLDYLLANDSLANKIYKELAEAYAALGNTVKANAYLRLIKPGF
jgi:tetratricopeptide (TPR) repeat protein